MATKRRSAKQREAEKREALLQRIQDIYSGACGRAMDEQDDCYASPSELSRVVPALQECFGTNQKKAFIWSPHNLEHFENPFSATDFLFRHDFRADEVWMSDKELEEQEHKDA